MVSTLDAAKRVLVVLLRTLAATYNCAVGVTRDSSDAVIRKAYRTMSLKTHPDKGGAARLPRSHGGWGGGVPIVNLIRITTQSLPESKLTIPNEPPLPLDPSDDLQ